MRGQREFKTLPKSSTRSVLHSHVRNVPIKVFMIGNTESNDEEIRKWLDHIGATSYPWPQLANGDEVVDDESNVEDGVEPLHVLTGAESIIGLAAKRCYLAFEASLNPNLTRVRKDWSEYFNNILASGHGSVCEHATYNFAIEGVSRVFTGEMNRHRAGVAISEGSMRYIRFNDIPWWFPTSLEINDKDGPILRRKKEKSREIFAAAFTFAQDRYIELVELWDMDNPEADWVKESGEKFSFRLKKILTSCFRRIIPMGVATGGVWTINIRALRHILALRGSIHAEEEIFLVASQMAKMIVEKEPRLLGDIVPDENGYLTPKYLKV